MQWMSSVRAACYALALGCLPQVALAQAGGATEPQLKAAFVYNFTKFVEWPAGSGSDEGKSLRLCAAGEGPVVRLLPELDGKAAQGRTLAVRGISTAKEAAACHAVFVSGVGSPRVADVLQATRGLPILTVSDAAGFADAGGIIGIVLADERLRFEVNLGRARDGGLKVSAHLLKLASSVKGVTP